MSEKILDQTMNNIGRPESIPMDPVALERSMGVIGDVARDLEQLLIVDESRRLDPLVREKAEKLLSDVKSAMEEYEKFKTRFVTTPM